MNEQMIDSLTRRVVAGVSRRDSLLALGGAGLAALAGVSMADAGKKSKKRKKDKRCKRQVGQCNGVFAPICAEEDAPVDCVEQTGACCAFLDDCQADAFIDCFFALIRPPAPEEDLDR